MLSYIEKKKHMIILCLNVAVRQRVTFLFMFFVYLKDVLHIKKTRSTQRKISVKLQKVNFVVFSRIQTKIE